MRQEIASDAVVDQAYSWLCRQREHYRHNQDVWNVRWRWERLKGRLQDDLRAGRYRLGHVQLIQRKGETIELWSAMDALVLKAIAIVLSGRLQLPRSCHHLKDHGGAKAALRAVAAHLPGRPFVYRTDVKRYYASLDHDLLMSQLTPRIKDPCVLALIERHIRRTIYQDGCYRDVKRGVGLGCPLSPIMAALYLAQLDERIERTGLFYARFMDDWVVLAPTRWQLRKALRLARQTLDELKLEPHPDKTFVGRVAHGFTFLGYTIASAGLTGIAPQTRKRFAERLTRLYEQGASPKRIGNYVRRWQRWVFSGLDGLYDPVAPWRLTVEPSPGPA